LFLDQAHKEEIERLEKLIHEMQSGAHDVSINLQNSEGGNEEPLNTERSL
jgi:hypothetical protein